MENFVHGYAELKIRGKALVKGRLVAILLLKDERRLAHGRVELDKADAIAEQVATGYTAATGITPTIFLSRPAQGARVLRSP